MRPSSSVTSRPRPRPGTSCPGSCGRWAPKCARGWRKVSQCTYKSGRSDLWQKIRADKTGDFVVVGYTAPKGTRGGFGALHLGGYDDGRLVYAGRAGSGFTGQMLKDVGDQLLALETPRPPFEGPVPAEKESHWVKPELVAEVRYKEVTGDGLLRQPVSPVRSPPNQASRGRAGIPTRFRGSRSSATTADCVSPGRW